MFINYFPLAFSTYLTFYIVFTFTFLLHYAMKGRHAKFQHGVNFLLRGLTRWSLQQLSVLLKQRADISLFLGWLCRRRERKKAPKQTRQIQRQADKTSGQCVELSPLCSSLLFDFFFLLLSSRNDKTPQVQKKTWSNRQDVRQTEDRQTDREESIKIHTIVLSVHVNNRAQASLKRR